MSLLGRLRPQAVIEFLLALAATAHYRMLESRLSFQWMRIPSHVLPAS